MGKQPDRAMTLWGVVSESARRWGSRPAIRLETASRTYDQLVEGAEIIRPGERVGLLLPNSADYLEIVIGAASIGIVTVPMNMRFKAREVRHLVTDSAMAALITVHSISGVVDFGRLLNESLPELASAETWSALSLASAPALRCILRLDDRDAAMLPISTAALPKAPTSEDVLFILYTSGTTANPKGCMIPHRALTSNCWAIADRFALSEQDRWWCPLPMFHIGGLLFPSMMFAVGGTYLGMIHFEPEAAIRMMRDRPPTIFYPLFPTITLAVTEHRDFHEIDFSRLRYLFNVAPQDVQRKIQAAVPQAPLFGAFGMTEASGVVCYGLPGDETPARYTTCGTPLPGWEVRILDPHAKTSLPIGARGEIAIRGPGLFQGYLGDPDLTRAQMTMDGFFLTGDVGSLDPEGRLSFHGRFKDQLKVGGENVSALEVESVLASHPAIHLAQVVGIPDDRYGEVPVAFVELKPGQAVTETEVISFCRGQIARFKVPRHVRFVSKWPMSATKIVKYRLKEQIEAELGLSSGD
jgi:acyl-CoA synthetase (AMP-forming)/AMP-acid ligase II